MANNIKTSENFVKALDEIYKDKSTTTEFDSGEQTVKLGQNAGEFSVAQLDMSGLKDYSRNDGYKNGAVALKWETHKCNYDRGDKFTVDEMDNEETIELAFGRLAGEFERLKVVPEGDAFFYAHLSGVSGISKVPEGVTYATGLEVLKALQEAQNKMDEDEVPFEDRHLRITPTLLRMAKSVKLDENRGVLDEFASIKTVPQSRFYTAIDLLNDETDQSTLQGGFKKASLGKAINFMIIEKSAVIKFDKHKVGNIIVPDDNQSSDGYIMKYRRYGIVDTYPNKVAGIYLSHKA